MRFSIIIPAYNAEDYIRTALDSIRSQTFTDYELIVCCDSCTDNTVEIACEYADIVRVGNWRNDGMARNAGLDVATGEWVLFMDDDDRWMHNDVLRQLDAKITADCGNIDILHFGFFWKGRGPMTPTSNNGRHFVAVWSKAWRRSFIGDARFPNVYAESDAHFSFGLFKKTDRQLDWNYLIYYYNWMRPGSISWLAAKERERHGHDPHKG